MIFNRRSISLTLALLIAPFIYAHAATYPESPAIPFNDSSPVMPAVADYYTATGVNSVNVSSMTGFSSVPVYHDGTHEAMFIPQAMAAASLGALTWNGDEWRMVEAVNADAYRTNHLFSNYLPTVTASEQTATRQGLNFLTVLAYGNSIPPTEAPGLYVTGASAGTLTFNTSNSYTAAPLVTLNQTGPCVTQSVSIFASNGNSISTPLPGTPIASEGPAPNPTQALYRLPGDYCTF